MVAQHVVIMGVSGTGKTTIGEGIAEQLGMLFIEGDSFHPQSNIDKMSAGIALDDNDRKPWLEALASEISVRNAAGISTVTACSALRRAYRDVLRTGARQLIFLHLRADYDILLKRMQKRSHYMPGSLLQSQFDTLEPLEADENGVELDDSKSIEEVLAAAIRALKSLDAAQPS